MILRIFRKSKRLFYYLQGYGILQGSKIILRYLSKRIKRAKMYISGLGVRRGSSILLNFLSSGNYTSFQIEGYRSPIWLRKHTSDIRIFEQVFLAKEYNFELYNLAPQLIIDAGANVGYSSIYFAKKYPMARIIAIEPDSTNYAMLLRNVEPYLNITPVKAALWSKKCNLEIRNPKAAKWAIQVKEAGEDDSQNKILAITINDIFTLAACTQIDILKLDIEGAEKELFEKNCEDWLSNVKVIVIELHSWIEGNEECFNNAIKRFGFRKEFCSGEKIIAIKP